LRNGETSDEKSSDGEISILFDKLEVSSEE
jgi:hypothetical protein